jgi:hypothetical protein
MNGVVPVVDSVAAPGGRSPARRCTNDSAAVRVLSVGFDAFNEEFTGRVTSESQA